MLRIRGMESNSPSGLAEGFYGRKVILTPTPGPRAADRASGDAAILAGAAPLSNTTL